MIINGVTSSGKLQRRISKFITEFKRTFMISYLTARNSHM